jgi:hypothetical protein
MDLYEPKSGRFYHFPFQFQGINGYSFIRQIAEDRDGSIWVIQGRDVLVHVQIPASWKDGLPDKSELIGEVVAKQVPVETYRKEEIMIRMEPGADGLNLFSTEKQYRIDRQAGVARPVGNPLLPSYIGSVAVQKNKKDAWAAGNQDELFCMSAEGRVRYQSPVPWLRYHYFIDYDRDGRYWMAHGNKLWELRADRPFDYSRPDWETDRDINCMEVDRNGNIWLGTQGTVCAGSIPAGNCFTRKCPDKVPGGCGKVRPAPVSGAISPVFILLRQKRHRRAWKRPFPNGGSSAIWTCFSIRTVVSGCWACRKKIISRAFYDTTQPIKNCSGPIPSR